MLSDVIKVDQLQTRKRYFDKAIGQATRIYHRKKPLQSYLAQLVGSKQHASGCSTEILP
jgi:hypothetical protein